MSYLAIAALQLELGVEDNLSLLEQEIDLVKRRFPWIQMVVLPELCTYGPSTDLAVRMPGEVENCFREVARNNDIWLIPGSIFERAGDRVHNTAPVIDPNGEVVARYRKHYPFLPYEQGVSGGDQFVVFDVPDVGRLGLMICYDMWYPEMSRQMAWMGAEAIIVPTLTNTNDRNIELSIAQTVAAINQLYLVNVNSAGRLAYGRSIVVGPDGTVLHQASTGREIITMELDFKHVRRVRERGMHGLAQPLKSFRDAGIEYPVYQAGAGTGAFTDLGPLRVPGRHSELQDNED
ncbi:MAG: carbon-nitrogen hydrolase family protein [Xanthomonadales bacterium]|nr:carbon-nitrogen hydrolase family protein [Xanthomonadales bacterium]NNL95635.1 carbon-nitrogen hydrolase family protein [Xanthomonadales bacterium]